MAENHLLLDLDDINEHIDGYVVPGEDACRRPVPLRARLGPHEAPLVVHCYAGISRSTAGAFVAACALKPKRDETTIARALRAASPTATPNRRIVALADQILGRNGRMVTAVDQILGPAWLPTRREPFWLDFE